MGQKIDSTDASTRPAATLPQWVKASLLIAVVVLAALALLHFAGGHAHSGVTRI